MVIIDKNMFDNAPSDHVDIQSFSINKNVGSYEVKDSERVFSEPFKHGMI
mgnify:CR=1 FL=1